MPDGTDDPPPVAEEARRTVADILADRRDVILQNWIQRVGQEPFHLGRSERAVADHIPKLIDALVENLLPSADEREPLGYRAQSLREAASEHARSRLIQGLWISEVITELRILVQEASREIRAEVSDEELPLEEVLAAELVVYDVLFGAAVTAAQALEEALRQERSETAGLIVHDLRTPLTTIKGYAQLLGRDPESERVGNAASVIVSQVSRLMEWIERFLTASQASMRTTELLLKPMDIKESIEGIVSSMGDEARRRVKIRVEPSAETSGDWDAMQIQRLLENVIANALKYAAEGDVDVLISNDADRRVVVQVKDQGIGVSASDRAQVFAPFYRSDDAIQHKIEGTGLGLFIAQGIAAAHGGELTLESPGVGKGTTVTLVLPRKNP
ncbi:MAG TPA: sensor histidine kinase [Dehalococcoidia bacterium]|nr:sensor histidine kinase [Dehalococcoidia bacterium]